MILKISSLEALERMPGEVLSESRVRIQKAQFKMLRDWHRWYFERHFKRGAFQRYRAAYKARSPGYANRKKREGFGDAPLVRTGTMRNSLRSIQRVQPGRLGRELKRVAKANLVQLPVTSELVYPAAVSYTFLRRARKSGESIVKPDEITFINDSERQTLSRSFLRHFNATR